MWLVKLEAAGSNASSSIICRKQFKEGDFFFVESERKCSASIHESHSGSNLAEELLHRALDY